MCKRTLRRDVQQFVSYTQRSALVQEFTPSTDEQQLSALVADYLRRPDLQALPNSQRNLISMVLWKLLASCTHAIAGAMETMANRLQGLLDATADRCGARGSARPRLRSAGRNRRGMGRRADAQRDASEAAKTQQAITAELAELRGFVELARRIRDNAKGDALLKALDRAFEELERLQAPRKGHHLHRVTAHARLPAVAAGDKRATATASCSSTAPTATREPRHLRATGCNATKAPTASAARKTADTRAALVEHFRDRGTVMIATEAGAEGINLQFCSLVINYDLPWNPQRIEQRIGRCHRYGQKHDVVVVNFSIAATRPTRASTSCWTRSSNSSRASSAPATKCWAPSVRRGLRAAHCRDLPALPQPQRNPRQLRAIAARPVGRDQRSDGQDAADLLENFDDEVHEKVRVRAARGRCRAQPLRALLMDSRPPSWATRAFDGDGAFDLRHAPAPTSTTCRSVATSCRGVAAKPTFTA